MFCAPRLNFGGTEGVGFRFHVLRSINRFRRYRGIGSRCHVLRSRIHFRRYRGRRVRFLCFALQDSISAVPRASGSVFMFCAPRLVFDDTEGVESRFYVLCSRTHFRRYRGCRVPFSCFTHPDQFFALPTASVLLFLFCAPGPILGGTDGVGSRFHVLRSRTHFRRYRGRWVSFSCFKLPDSFLAISRRRVPLSCFALPNSFSAVPRVSGAVFMFSLLGLIFGGTECVGSSFHVLRSRTHFRRYRRRRVPFSCFALPDLFLAVPRASGPVFMFCAPGLIFDDTKGVGSRFLVLRSQTYFRRYQRRWVPFSCFALPDSFSTVPWASSLVFIFCALGPIFSGINGVGSRFHVLRS
jgi:hypothetical protein